MKFTRVVPASLIPLLVSGAAIAQDGHMTGGGMGSLGGMGYGGIWLPVLAVIAFAALVIWIIKQKSK